MIKVYKEDDKYYFHVVARNGTIIAESKKHNSEASVQNAIESICRIVGSLMDVPIQYTYK